MSQKLALSKKHQIFFFFLSVNHFVNNIHIDKKYVPIGAVKAVSLIAKWNDKGQIHPSQIIVIIYIRHVRSCHINTAHVKDLKWASLDGPMLMRIKDPRRERMSELQLDDFKNMQGRTMLADFS